MAKPIGPRKIGQYSNEFKVKAVRLTFLDGTQIQEVARALDIHPFMLSRWRRVVRVTRRQPGWHRFCEGATNRRKGAGRPQGPDQQWAGDNTYLPVQGKWKYLAVVLDLYSRKVIRWMLGDRRTVDVT